VPGLRGFIVKLIDSIEGWVLAGIIGISLLKEVNSGVVTALIAYCIDVWESVFFDWKEGYCSSTSFGDNSNKANWTLDQKFCCWNQTRISYYPRLMPQKTALPGGPGHLLSLSQ
jgi:chloride channel 3/4/5